MCTLSYWQTFGGAQWKNNRICPECGSPIENLGKYQSAETGYSYCSWECAKIHPNRVYNEGKNDE